MGEHRPSVFLVRTSPKRLGPYCQDPGTIFSQYGPRTRSIKLRIIIIIVVVFVLFVPVWWTLYLVEAFLLVCVMGTERTLQGRVVLATFENPHFYKSQSEGVAFHEFAFLPFLPPTLSPTQFWVCLFITFLTSSLMPFSTWNTSSLVKLSARSM